MGDRNNSGSLWGWLGAAAVGVAVSAIAAGVVGEVAQQGKREIEEELTKSDEGGSCSDSRLVLRQNRPSGGSACVVCNRLEDLFGEAPDKFVCGHFIHKKCFLLSNMVNDDYQCPQCKRHIDI